MNENCMAVVRSLENLWTINCVFCWSIVYHVKSDIRYCVQLSILDEERKREREKNSFASRNNGRYRFDVGLACCQVDCLTSNLYIYFSFLLFFVLLLILRCRMLFLSLMHGNIVFGKHNSFFLVQSFYFLHKRHERFQF